MHYLSSLIIIAMLSLDEVHAVLTEPTYQAAEAMSFLVVGEIEFQRGSYHVSNKAVDDQVREIHEICPRTVSQVQGISSFARFVLLAWSDVEFPSQKVSALSFHHQELAQRRAHFIAEKLRTQVRGPLSFELVNMGHRIPHPIRVSDHAQSRHGSYDVKRILEHAGGAPSGPYEMGLFGENGQSSKVIIWVDCKETLGPRRKGMLANVQLAQVGANFFTFAQQIRTHAPHALGEL